MPPPPESIPDNRLLWRFPIRRMDAEEVRDAVLSLSGLLLRDEIGGPSVFPEIEQEVRMGLSRPDEGWPTSPQDRQHRRSLYVFSKRALPLPLFQAFDFPETDSTCEGRFQTVQPTQALSLLNSRFMQQQAAVVAARLRADISRRDETHDVRAAIELLLDRAYRRPIRPAEVTRLMGLYADLQTSNGDLDPLTMVVLAVLNTSEFLYLD